ncbi:acyl-CoA thioesterase [Candidatus Woesearchaeota archaeon]|nr:acyl-CoA thioesterase [Candidatus Woesearchaeota archaeon]
MQAKSAAEAAVTMVREMFPRDANANGDIYGGRILDLFDEVSGIVAKRHAQSHCVTAAVHDMVFEKPVAVGNLIHITGRVVYVGRTSMTLRIEMDREERDTGKRERAAWAYFTYVAVRKGKPIEVPRLLLQSDEEKRLWHEAEALRKR